MNAQPLPGKDVNAALAICSALGDAIRDLGSVPSGHLYARVMGQMSIGTYNLAIGALKRARLVEEKSHLLVWVGPKKETKS